MLGCIGTVIAAIITGIITLIAAGKIPFGTSELQVSSVATQTAVIQTSTQPTYTPYHTESPLPTYTPYPTQPPPAPIQPTEVALPTIDLSASQQPYDPPADSACPYDPRTGWLYAQQVWFGPFEGYWIGNDLGFFYVYDPYQWDTFYETYGVYLPYSTQIDRNSWILLDGSPFWVCVDTPGNVYTVYLP